MPPTTTQAPTPATPLVGPETPPRVPERAVDGEARELPRVPAQGVVGAGPGILEATEPGTTTDAPAAEPTAETSGGAMEPRDAPDGEPDPANGLASATNAEQAARKGTTKKGTTKKGTTNKGTAERGTAERDTAERDTTERDTTERDTTEKGASEVSTETAEPAPAERIYDRYTCQTEGSAFSIVVHARTEAGAKASACGGSTEERCIAATTCEPKPP
jgi:hypothetical protein